VTVGAFFAPQHGVAGQSSSLKPLDCHGATRLAMTKLMRFCSAFPSFVIILMTSKNCFVTTLMTMVFVRTTNDGRPYI